MPKIHQNKLTAHEIKRRAWWAKNSGRTLSLATELAPAQPLLEISAHRSDEVTPAQSQLQKSEPRTQEVAPTQCRIDASTCDTCHLCPWCRVRRILSRAMTCEYLPSKK